MPSFFDERENSFFFWFFHSKNCFFFELLKFIFTLVSILFFYYSVVILWYSEISDFESPFKEYLYLGTFCGLWIVHSIFIGGELLISFPFCFSRNFCYNFLKR